jgi:hypothetical protein
MPAQRPSPASDRDPIHETNEPEPAAIAQEAAAIYPDTNEGRPTPDEIAAEAYRIYMGKGAAHGGDLDDWLEAERRLARTRQTEPR